MAKKSYMDLIYVFSSILAFFAFTLVFIVYLLYKEVKIYSAATGLIMLILGFIAKRRLDASRKF